MNLSETLFNSFKRMHALRQIAALFRSNAGRQPLGYGAKLRMRRMDWIRESQTQGVAVAAARKKAREEGTMLDHLKHYYPMHRHDRRA